MGLNMYCTVWVGHVLCTVQLATFPLYNSVNIYRFTRVLISLSLRAERPGFDSPQVQGKDLYLFVTTFIYKSWWPPTLLSSGFPRLFFPEVKRPEHEADHLPPSSAEVKNAWSYIFTVPYVFMTSCLVKHRMCLHDVVFS